MFTGETSTFDYKWQPILLIPLIDGIVLVKIHFDA